MLLLLKSFTFYIFIGIIMSEIIIFNKARQAWRPTKELRDSLFDYLRRFRLYLLVWKSLVVVGQEAVGPRVPPATENVCLLFLV